MQESPKRNFPKEIRCSSISDLAPNISQVKSDQGAFCKQSTTSTPSNNTTISPQRCATKPNCPADSPLGEDRRLGFKRQPLPAPLAPAVPRAVHFPPTSPPTAYTGDCLHRLPVRRSDFLISRPAKRMHHKHSSLCPWRTRPAACHVGTTKSHASVPSCRLEPSRPRAWELALDMPVCGQATSSLPKRALCHHPEKWSPNHPPQRISK